MSQTDDPCCSFVFDHQHLLRDSTSPCLSQSDLEMLGIELRIFGMQGRSAAGELHPFPTSLYPYSLGYSQALFIFYETRTAYASEQELLPLGYPCFHSTLFSEDVFCIFFFFLDPVKMPRGSIRLWAISNPQRIPALLPCGNSPECQ